MERCDVYRMNWKVRKFLELPRVGVTEISQWRCLQSQGCSDVKTTRVTFRFHRKNRLNNDRDDV